MRKMSRRRGTGLFEALQIGWLAEENLRNPPPAKPRELTPAEVKANRNRTISAAYEEQYRKDCQKRDAESREAQSAGRRSEIFGYMKASEEERKQFARCNPDILEAEIIEWRKLGKPSEGLATIYEVLTGGK
jgi:hypothetical protein